MPVYSEVLQGHVIYDEFTAHEIAFKNIQYKIDTNFLAPYKIDYDYKEHYITLRDNHSEIVEDDKIICPFYFKNLLVVYGIKYRNNPRVIPYYNAYGKIKQVEIVEESNNYPFRAFTYTPSGKLTSVLLYVSASEQFTFNSSGKLLGHWVGNKYFGSNGKEKIR